MKHFKISEFDSPDLENSGVYMKEEFLEKIDKARSIANIPFKINSGFRTKAHNKKIGGSENSSHMNGVACDIHCVDSHSRQIIVNALIQAGFTRIGIAKTFVHADTDQFKNDALWLY